MPLRNITVILTANATSLSAGLTAASAEVRSFGSDVRAASVESTAATQRIGKSFLVGGAIVIGGLAAASYAAIQFERDMRNVGTISGYVRKNFSDVGDAVIALSNKLPQSAHELARGLYDVASSGFAGSSGMRVLDQSAQAASAGLSTTATAARVITGALNAYGLSAKSARSVSDILFQTVNLGVITFEEMAQSIGNVYGIASQTSVPLKDVGAAFATITLSGIPAAEAATRLRRVIQSFIDPSKAMDRALHSLGYESGVSAIKQDGLRTVMMKLMGATGGNITALSQLFPEVRALGGALALTAGNGEAWTRVARGMDDATRGAGATHRALVEQQKSLGFQLEVLKNQFVNFGIGIGQQILPALHLVAQGLAGFFSTLRGMPPEIQTVVAVMGVLTGAVLLGAGAWITISSRIAAARANLVGMGAAGSTLNNFIGIAGRLTALAGGVASLAYGFSQLGQSTEGTVIGIVAIASGVGLLRSVIGPAQEALLKLGLAMSNIGGGGAGVPGWIGGMINGLGRLGQVMPGLAASITVMTLTMDHMGESSAEGIVNMLSMAATGAQLGYVIAGPVGAAIGGFAGLIAGPLMSALGVGGQSVADYRAEFEKLAGTINAATDTAATNMFLDKLGDEDRWKLISGNVRGVTDEIVALGTKSPYAAQKVADGLFLMYKNGQLAAGNGMTLTQVHRVLQGAVDESTKKFQSSTVETHKAADANQHLGDSALKAAGAQKQQGDFSDAAAKAAKKAADEYEKAMRKIADAATQNLPTVSSAFDEAAKAANKFGVQVNPEQIIGDFEKTIETQLNFGQNLAVIFKAGYTQLGQLIAQKGPAVGGQVAQTLADGIRDNDAPKIEQAAKLEGLVQQSNVFAQVFHDAFTGTWGPKIQAAAQEAFARLSPEIKKALGIDVPAAVAESGPPTVEALGAVAVAGSSVFGGNLTPSHYVPPALQAVADAVPAASPSIDSAMQNSAAAATSVFGGNFVPSVHVPPKIQAIADAVPAAQPSIDSAMINAAVAGTSVFGGNFTPAVPAGQNMANAAGAISAAGIVLYGSGAAAGQQGTAGTESGLSGMGPAGTQGVADAAAGITGGGGEVSGASTGVGEGGTTALGEGLGGMSGEAQQAVDEAGNTIATTGFALIGNARSVGTGIGAAFGQGIASGILSWIGSIQAAAAEAVNKAEAAARAASDSASPSKLFMKVGRDMGAGLAMGVTKSQADVSDAMRGLVGATALPVYSNPGIARAVMTPAGSRAQGGPIQIHSEFTVNGDVYGVDDLEAKFHELADVRDRRLSIALQRNRSVT